MCCRDVSASVADLCATPYPSVAGSRSSAQGIRAVGIRTHAMSETPLIEEVFDLHAEADGITRDQFRANIECSTHLQPLPTLSELAEVATFVASDHARSM